MAMIHLIELTERELNTKVVLVVENISSILDNNGTMVNTNNGNYVLVKETIGEITNRIKEILYGEEEK